MNLKRITIMLIALAFAAGTAIGEPAPEGRVPLSVRSFTFKTKEADKAAAAIKNLLSAHGSMSIQPSTNALVVTDHPENLKAITKALADFDTQSPTHQINISIRLVAASRVEAGPRTPPHDLEDVAAKMAMFRFNNFESAGEANVDGKEGDAEVVDMPTGYRAEFKIGEYDPASDSVKVSDFHLSRLQKDQLTSLLKTTLNLRIGQMYIVGASKTAQSQRALMIVITARR
jgi:hypothetical protein